MLSRARPRRRRVDKPQFHGFVTDLIGSGLERSDCFGEPSPQAFLVEQPPRWQLQTHFHLRHQFQVVVQGAGTLGRHPVGPLAIHYASAYSAYGPLVAGEAGLSYLTLRVTSDTAAWYLPDAREHLKLRIPKQQVHAAPSCNADVPLDSSTGPQQETLIAPDAGGLAAWMVRLPGHADVAAPPGGTAGSGRFYVVTKGSLRVAGEELEGLATVFVSSDDVLALRSGAGGAEVLVLQFPGSALQPPSD